jgi:putative DNA primase/helicase
VVVAFHAGNLPAVAEAFREKYPEAILILAGDNDHHKLPEKNVGRLKSQEAAEKVSGYTLLPEFGKNDAGSDWNDLVKQYGKEVVQHRLKIGITVAEKKHQEQKQEKTAQISKEPDKALVQSGGRSLSL